MAKNGKKSGSTRVETKKILKIAEQLGLQTVAKAGWIRVEGANKGQRLLVHTGKRGTNCVELVGFESEYAVAHPCPPAKTMTQLIDFNVPEKQILRAIYKTAKGMAVAEVPAPAPEAEVTEPEAIEEAGEVSIEEQEQALAEG